MKVTSRKRGSRRERVDFTGDMNTVIGGSILTSSALDGRPAAPMLRIEAPGVERSCSVTLDPDETRRVFEMLLRSKAWGMDTLRAQLMGGGS